MHVIFFANWNVCTMPAVFTSYTLTSVPIVIAYVLPSGDHSKQDMARPFPVRFLETTIASLVHEKILQSITINTTMFLILFSLLLFKNLHHLECSCTNHTDPLAQYCIQTTNKQTNSVALSPRANYTD
jgi:hypothetical protein